MLCRRTLTPLCEAREQGDISEVIGTFIFSLWTVVAEIVLLLLFRGLGIWLLPENITGNKVGWLFGLYYCVGAKGPYYRCCFVILNCDFSLLGRK